MVCATLACSVLKFRGFVPCGWRLVVATSVLLADAGADAQGCAPLTESLASALTLAAALERTRDCHPDVRAAAGSLAAADADVITSGQGPNPQLTLGAGSVSRDLGAGPWWNKTFDHQIRIDQTIERGGKPALRRAAAETLREAARLDLSEAVRRAQLSVTQGYHELAAALARRAEIAAAYELAIEAQRAQNLRVKAGDAAPVDATRLALDAIRVQADLRQAEADMRAARIQLSTALGAPEWSDKLMPSDAQVPQLDRTSAAMAAESIATDRRPDVLAARTRLLAAELARDLARAQRVRDVGVGVQLDHWPVSASNASGTGNTVSLSVSVPLFVRHGLEGELARSEADVANARETLRRAQLTAQSELRDAADAAGTPHSVHLVCTP